MMKAARVLTAALAVPVAFVVLSAATADAQTDQKVVLLCTYQNGTETWVLDFAAKTVTSVSSVGGGTRHGVIAQTTDEKVVMVFDNSDPDSAYTLNRYTLGLSLHDPARIKLFGDVDEAPIPCQRQQKQL